MKKYMLVCGIMSVSVLGAYGANIDCHNRGTCVEMLAHYETSDGGFLGCVDASTCTCDTQTYPCVCYTNSDCGYEYYCAGGRCQPCTSSTCTYSCSSCSDTWVVGNTGYEKTTRVCARNGACDVRASSQKYRCAAGYYGTSSNGTSGCTRCPSNGNSNAGTTSITGCYITSGSDATGSYVYTSNCYYKN
ncbi:MAG: hypothetical protein K2L94_03010 [Alphaproteobacteria bacterium]|nr:hypothetical protein [Alphaproteobacteria bacterium]